MTSRSERRLACPAALRPHRALTTPMTPPADAPIVRAAALDAPQELFVATVWFDATTSPSGSDLHSSPRDIQTLKPFSCERRADSLVCRFLCTGVDPEATAWRVVDHIREVTTLPLQRVEIGSADAAHPAAILTSRHQPPA